MRDIGKNIKDLREKKGLTQDELAGLLFVTRQTVSNYENGRSRPDVDMLIKISQELEADVNHVLYGLPEQEDRRVARRRMVICGIALAAMLLLSATLYPLANKLITTHYLTIPKVLMKLLFDPIFMLLLGWSLMHAVALLSGAKPFSKPWVRQAKRGVLVLLAVCFLLLCPYAIWSCTVLIQQLSRNSVSWRFPVIPVYQQLLHFLMNVNIDCPAIYCVFGAALCGLASRT